MSHPYIQLCTPPLSLHLYILRESILISIPCFQFSHFYLLLYVFFFFSINTVPPIVLLLLHPQRVLFSIHAQYFMTHKALINTNLLPMESDEYYYSFFFLFLVHSFVFFFFFLLLRVKRLFLGLFVDGGRH